MQFLDFLDLKGQTITDFIVEAGWAKPDSPELPTMVATIWRHAHGKRRPGTDDIDRYDAATKGAVTVQDWHELARQTEAERRGDAPQRAAASG